MIDYPSPIGRKVEVGRLLHSVREAAPRGTEMEAGDLDPECRRYRELIQQAWEILIEERAFSTEEAHRYLCEVAQARKLFIVEVAGRIVAGEWVRTEISQELTCASMSKWLGCC